MDALLSNPRFLSFVAIVGYLMWQGIRRRRGVWSPPQWWRFAALLLLAIAALGSALRMGIAVDEGIYAGMAPAARKAYLWTMMVLMVAGTLGTVGVLYWFARGRPKEEAKGMRGSLGSGA